MLQAEAKNFEKFWKNFSKIFIFEPLPVQIGPQNPPRGTINRNGTPIDKKSWVLAIFSPNPGLLVEKSLIQYLGDFFGGFWGFWP